MMEELIGLYICRKMSLNNIIIFNDEGLFQRLLSGVGNFKKDINKIFTYVSILDAFFFNKTLLFTKSSIKNIKSRSKKRKEGFKFNKLNDNEIKLWINIFNKFYKIYKKNKIYLVQENNCLKISKDIIKNL